jgi:protein SFI1
MLPFVPQHASSLLESTTNASLCHESSSHAAPELQNLSPQDIRIIDAVIERAGPSATTFFTVFKAYSEVLKEHGLDPQEVVYYGKLLKLGTLRGKNWGEKWVSVKSQMSQVCQSLYS